MVKFTSRGDWKKTNAFLKKNRNRQILTCLEQYGARGVSALKNVTPKDTGKTAESWSYKASLNKNGARLEFFNDNVNDGTVIAIVLQYGHVSESGYWIEGQDYINPALSPVFRELADEVWRKISK